jgi:hypothetical protein
MVHVGRYCVWPLWQSAPVESVKRVVLRGSSGYISSPFREDKITIGLLPGRMVSRTRSVCFSTLPPAPGVTARHA